MSRGGAINLDLGWGGDISYVQGGGGGGGGGCVL